MKFTCNTQKLAEALSVVSKAVNTKSTPIRALECILIKTKTDSIYISGYDLTLGISTNIDATIQEEGEIILNARLVCEMIKKMPDTHVSFSTNDELLIMIKSQNTKFNILGLPASEFPELPQFDEINKIELPEATMKSMISQTIYATAQNDVKPVHNGTLFDITNNPEKTITLIALDGSRVAIRKEKITSENTAKFVVPYKTLMEINRILTDDEKNTISLSVGKKHIIFQIQHYSIISRLLEGDFIDCFKNQKTPTTTTIINTRDFTSCLERVSLVVNEQTRSAIKLKTIGNTIELTCKSSLGDASDSFVCEKTGNELEIGFNHKYMLEALRYTETDKVKISFTGNNMGSIAPIRIEPIDGDNFLFLILPMRIRF